MRPAKARRLARELLPLLTDGRPDGCKCPPDGVNALPSDNRHIGAKRCPLTPKVSENELAEVNRRIDDLGIALKVVVGQARNATGDALLHLHSDALLHLHSDDMP